MKKVSVQNIKNGLKFEGRFPKQTDAEEWIEKQTQLKSWGESADDFIVNVEDISEEENNQKQLSKVRWEQTKGRVVRDKLSAMIRYKLINKEITIEQLATFVELPAVIRVERYLDNGYLTLAKLTMQTGDFGSIITEEERQQFILEL